LSFVDLDFFGNSTQQIFTYPLPIRALRGFYNRFFLFVFQSVSFKPLIKVEAKSVRNNDFSGPVVSKQAVDKLWAIR